MKGHPVFIAQHATATCCRGCLWKWYRIEKGRSLTEDEIGFVVELVMGGLMIRVANGEQTPVCESMCEKVSKID